MCTAKTGGVWEMKRGLMIAVAALLAIASTASMAFDEQPMKGGPAAAPSAAAPKTGGVQIDPKSLGMSPSDLRAAKPEAGTKIRIPVYGLIELLDYKMVYLNI